MVNNTTNLELNKQLNNTNIQGFENSDIKNNFPILKFQMLII